MKFKPVTNADGSVYGVRWDCPGCKHAHDVPTTGPKAWGFNGDMEYPTLTPSVLNRWLEENGTARDVCHVFIRDGRIEFLGDCTHALAGQTVDVPELETP